MLGADRDPLLESRIDAALRSYAEPPSFASDPRTAAAAILERARASQRRRSWWLWGIPAAAAVVALIILLVLRSPSPPNIAHTAVPVPAVPALHSTTPPPLSATVRPVHRALHRLNPHVAPLPRQSVFPTPAPLSSQEQALVVFARTAPPAVREAVIKEQSPWDEEVTPSPSPIHPIAQPDTERP